MFFQQRTSHSFLFTIIMAIVLLTSCTVIRNNPKSKPFVYSNDIIVEGIPSKDEKKRLQNELINYWDDSIRVKSISQFGVRTVIKNPPVYDSANVVRSIAFMNSYLNSQGYYNAVIHDNPPIFDTLNDQIRTAVSVNIELGKNLTIDSFAIDSSMNPDLRLIASQNMSASLFAKGKPFSKQLVSSELDRLVTLYRTQGYFRFTRDNLDVEVDTTDVSLLEIDLDPFDQARRIAEATQRRKLNPTVDVIIRQKKSADSSSFTKFYIGNIYYYPEAGDNEIADSVVNRFYQKVLTRREVTSFQNKGYIHLKPLREHTYLRRGVLYNEERFFKTVNALNQLGAWRQVDVKTSAKTDTVTVRSNETATATTYFDTAHVLDFRFLLTPAKKYSFGADFEVSRNTATISSDSGSISSKNLLGIAINTTLLNRNIWRESIQSSTAIRAGTEVSFSAKEPLQTFQTSLSQTYSIPEIIAPTYFAKRLKRLDTYKTLVNFSAGYTERRDFYRLRTVVGNWGYEWKRKNNLWIYRPLNLELYTLDTLKLLTIAFNDNPFLRTAFNTGYVISQNITYNKIYSGTRTPGVSNYIRLFGEEAGAILGRFLGISDKLYQYVKVEGEFRQRRQFIKTEFAYRIFGGIGYNYSSDPVLGQSLPFFKQFVAGGPNSMRAWPLRQLGLGSSLASDTSTTFKERYGDIQLETNLEYRFPIMVISGVKINSAVFTDIGNIWNLKNQVINPDSKISLNRFFKDLAIGMGTGLRIDFNYFLIRLDLAYKVKDPARLANNGWMSIKDFEWRNHEFENVDRNGRVVKRNNYAFQLGIGMPF